MEEMSEITGHINSARSLNARIRKSTWQIVSVDLLARMFMMDRERDFEKVTILVCDDI